MAMIDKWRKSLDTGLHAGAFLTDLSKAFDRNDHKLLVAKINGYGFDTDALKFITPTLREKQRTKINTVPLLKFVWFISKINFWTTIT